jgi:hypothetical protein
MAAAFSIRMLQSTTPALSLQVTFFFGRIYDIRDTLKKETLT